MNYRNGVLILFAVLAGLPLALAQNQQPRSGADVAMVATAQGDGTVLQRPARDTSSNVDVRFCLDSATNLEVIVCADKYRPLRRKAAG
jgi:hypothetical protein